MFQILAGLLAVAALSIYTLYRRVVALKIERNQASFERDIEEFQKALEGVMNQANADKEAYEKARTDYDAASKPPKG